MLSTQTNETIYTERMQRDLRKREALETQYENLSNSLVEIECNCDETTFRIAETLIGRRQYEIEQELLMLPNEPRE